MASRHSDSITFLVPVPTDAAIPSGLFVDLYGHRTPHLLGQALHESLMLASCADGCYFLPAAPGAKASHELISALRDYNSGAARVNPALHATSPSKGLSSSHSDARRVRSNLMDELDAETEHALSAPFKSEPAASLHDHMAESSSREPSRAESSPTDFTSDARSSAAPPSLQRAESSSREPSQAESSPTDFTPDARPRAAPPQIRRAEATFDFTPDIRRPLAMSSQQHATMTHHEALLRRMIANLQAFFGTFPACTRAAMKILCPNATGQPPLYLFHLAEPARARWPRLHHAHW